MNDHGTIVVEFARDAKYPTGLVVPLRIIGPAYELQQINAIVGQLLRYDIVAGPVLVQATLPSGEFLSANAIVEPKNDCLVTLPPQASVSRRTRHLFEVKENKFSHREGLQGVWESDYRMSLMDDFESRQRAVSEVVEMLRLVLWTQVRGLPGRDNGERRLIADGPLPLPLDEGLTVSIPGQDPSSGTAWLELRLYPGRAKFIALPPSTSETWVTIVRHGMDRRSPAALEAIAESHDIFAESLLNYCQSGDIAAARRIAPEIRDHARSNLADGNPYTALALEYFDLVAGVEDQPDGLLSVLAERYEFLPDVAVLKAWRLLKGREPNYESASQSLLAGAARGLPVLTCGLRFLIDGLRLVMRPEGANPLNSKIAETLEQLIEAVPVIDWQSRTTAIWLTFTPQG